MVSELRSQTGGAQFHSESDIPSPVVFHAEDAVVVVAGDEICAFLDSDLKLSVDHFAV
jgi:hypothetical protein